MLTVFTIAPTDLTLTVSVNVTLLPAEMFPIVHTPEETSYSPAVAVTGFVPYSSTIEDNFSFTLTAKASEEPVFVTVTVNLTTSVMFTFEVAFAVLVIFKST